MGSTIVKARLDQGALLAKGAISNPVYNTDGTLASATLAGIPYVFTYSFGKLATAVGGGVTKTYTWDNNQLTSVVVS